MTTPHPPSPDQPYQYDAAASPGLRLRQTREAHGLTLERVASELHLPPAVLSDLEQDHYDALPAPVFVTGYLRNYARLFDLDPEPLIAAYRAADRRAEGGATLRTRPQSSQIGSGHLAIRIVSLSIVVGLLVLVGLWWQNQQAPLDITAIEETGPLDPRPAAPSLDEDPARSMAAGQASNELDAMRWPGPNPAPPEGDAAAPASVTPRASPDTPERSASSSSSPPQAAPHGLASGSADTPGPEAEPEAKPKDRPGVEITQAVPEPGLASAPAAPSRAPPTEPVPPPPPAVELTFDGPCWVDIRDAAGDYKLFGEMAQGDRQVLGGTPPYSLIIGNTAVTKITIDGEPFDLASRSRGNVARFSLDPTAARAAASM